MNKLTKSRVRFALCTMLLGGGLAVLGAACNSEEQPAENESINPSPLTTTAPTGEAAEADEGDHCDSGPCGLNVKTSCQASCPRNQRAICQCNCTNRILGWCSEYEPNCFCQ